MSTAKANGAPKKPKAPMDYYVLECFKKMKDLGGEMILTPGDDPPPAAPDRTTARPRGP